VLTYTGQFVTIEQGAPTLRDIAIQLGRIPRFMGALKVFWPVLAHSIIVAKLCPPEARLYGLLHDAAEIIVGDTPRTIKNAGHKLREWQVLERIYEDLGIQWPSDNITAMVNKADDRALIGEAWVLGSENLKHCREFSPRDLEAERCVHDLLNRYLDYNDYLHPNGAMVKDYIRFVEEAMKQ
jgi:hypothetical protein